MSKVILFLVGILFCVSSPSEDRYVSSEERYVNELLAKDKEYNLAEEAAMAAANARCKPDDYGDCWDHCKYDSAESCALEYFRQNYEIEEVAVDDGRDVRNKDGKLCISNSVFDNSCNEDTGKNSDAEKGKRKGSNTAKEESANKTNSNNNLAEDESVDPRSSSKPDASKISSFERRLDSYIEEADGYADNCRATLDESNLCCSQPLSCLGKGENANMVGGLTLTGLQMYQMIKGSNATSPAESCRLMGQMSQLSAGIQTATAAVCTKQKSSCSRSCKQNLAKAESVFNKCVEKAIGAYKSRSKAESACWRVKTAVKSVANVSSQCIGLVARASEQSLNAASSLMAVNLNKKCQEAGENAPQITDFPDPANCQLPQNTNSPFCLATLCQNPGMAHQPQCAAYANILNNESNSSEGDSDLSDGDGVQNLAGVGDDEGDGFDQDPQFTDTEAEQGNYASGSGGSGGGVGFGGSGGSGGGSSRSGGGAQAAGPNQNLKSLFGKAKGGRGYSRSFARSGYKGRRYNNAGSRGYRGRKTVKFNLKEYLPGGRLYAKRKLSSVSKREKLGIGGKHESIWENVSRRYIYQCKTKQLKGCE